MGKTEEEEKEGARCVCVFAGKVSSDRRSLSNLFVCLSGDV